MPCIGRINAHMGASLGADIGGIDTTYSPEADQRGDYLLGLQAATDIIDVQ